MNNKQSGFGALGIILAVVAIAAVAAIGLVVYHQQHKTTSATNPTQTTNQQQATTKITQTTTTAKSPANPYAGWKTFTDNASISTSGISIKYPSGWQVNNANTKTYAWNIAQTGSTNNIITVSYVFQNGSQTAQQEWETCIGTDACGGSSSDKVLSGSESTINGLNAYAATVQSSYGTYHVTIIRGNKLTSQGTPFVQFTTYTTDQSALSIFEKIMASATFPN